jgi:hypothetical protein
MKIRFVPGRAGLAASAWLISSLLAQWVSAADRAPVNAEPLKMEPMLVSTIHTSIKLRPILRETVAGGRQVIGMLRVEDVRRKSAAERAGLIPGYEVISINGVTVKGLDEVELDKLWRGPFLDDELVLRVSAIRPGLAPQPYTIRIPLKKDPPIERTFTIQIGGQETPAAEKSAQAEKN